MWQALLEKHGFEIVETCKKLVLAKIVETHCSWLASSQGEGLVLNVGGQLAKLKSAGEAQHSTPGRLASCMKTAKLCVQEPLVLQTLETMIGLASMYVPCVLQGMSFLLMVAKLAKYCLLTFRNHLAQVHFGTKRLCEAW